MSYDKDARRVRRDNDRKQVKAQFRIVKFYHPHGEAGFGTVSQGSWRKQHALNCGRSRCHMCCNPRRISKAVTLQEERINVALKQDLEALFQED